jgi:DNA polymerase-3 subunit alpha
MAYAIIEDYNGEIETVFFPKVWEACQDRVQEDKVVIFKGKIEYHENKDKYNFIVDSWIDSRATEAAIAEEEAQQQKREKFRSAWLYMADLKSGGLDKAEKGNYTVIGQLAALRETQDKKGSNMAFGTLSDFEGDIDLVFFSKVWNENSGIFGLGEFIALRGSIDPAADRNPQKPSLKVTGVADLAALSRSAARKAAAGEQPKVPPLTVPPLGPPETHSVSDTETEQPDRTPDPPLQAIHISLDSTAAEKDEGIFPLRNYLMGNPGPCPVFIHIKINNNPKGFGQLPGGLQSAEKIIRTTGGLSLKAEKEVLGVLEGCTGVAQAWKEQCS